MPVKRRVQKRRVNSERAFEIWQSILTSGIDFFGELPELGLAPADDYGSPAAADAREAWATYGPRVMAERRANDPEPWALGEFGEP